MSRAQGLYQQLRAIGDVSVDRALAAALPTADPLARKLIALSLLERKEPGSAVALLQNYHLLDRDTQFKVIAQVEDLHRPLRRAAGGSDTQTWLNVIEVVRLARSARLAYLVGEQLRHIPSEVRQAAARCLLELAEWASTCPRKAPRRGGAAPRSASRALRPGRRQATGDEATSDGPDSLPIAPAWAGDTPPQSYPADGRMTAFIETAITGAVESFGVHGQTAVLVALAHLSPRPLTEARGHLAEASHPATQALRRLVEASETPAVRRALLWFVQIPTIADAALAGIAGVARRGQIGDLLGSAHLTIDGRMPPLLAKLRQPEQLVPAPDQLDVSADRGVIRGAELAPHEWRGLPQWIMALPLSPAQKVQKLAALDRAPDAPTRLAALRQLMALSARAEALGASAVIADFTNDPDPQLARIAVRHLIRHKWDGLMQLLLKLLNAAHPQMRALAAEELAPLGFDRLWSAWPRLSAAKQIAAGRGLIKIDPNFARHVGARLNQDDRDIRMRALSIIGRLHQGQFFEAALETLIQGPDERLASAAVQALGTSGSTGAVDALRNALDHSDSRVRANAVEALHELNSTEHLPRLIEMARSDENRPRANAIGVLLEMHADEAMHLLVDMLADKRSEQRTSALWLIDHLELVEVARQVAETSISDGDPDIRRRAKRVIQHLITALSPEEDAPAAAGRTKELAQ